MDESAEQQRARLAYEASLRTLEQQQRGVEEIRARTGILLPTAAVTASFLGARAIDDRASRLLSVLALVALLVTLVLGVAILVRHRSLGFSISGRALHQRLSDAPDPAEQHHRLAIWLDDLFDDNDAPISQLNGWFRIAAAAFVIQILCWTTAIGGTL
jgi:hypothetical protein